MNENMFKLVECSMTNEWRNIFMRTAGQNNFDLLAIFIRLN